MTSEYADTSIPSDTDLRKFDLYTNGPKWNIVLSYLETMTDQVFKGTLAHGKHVKEDRQTLKTTASRIKKIRFVFGKQYFVKLSAGVLTVTDDVTAAEFSETNEKYEKIADDVVGLL